MGRESKERVSQGEVLTAFLLFGNFFTILFIYSVARSVRGSMVLGDMGALGLPVLWVITAVSMGIIVTGYGRLLDFLPRGIVFSTTSLLFILSLLPVKILLPHGYGWLSGFFYVWGDLFAVVMTEQFWSLTSDLYDVKRAKKFFGWIGSGGIIGGIAGAAFTVHFVKSLGTSGLLSACFLLMIFQLLLTAVNETVLRRARRGKPTQPVTTGNSLLDGARVLIKSRYLIGILFFVVLTQVVSNIIDYQFNAFVEKAGFGADERTAYFGTLFVWVNSISLAGVLLWSPIFQRFIGVSGCLTALPVVDLIGTVLLWFFPGMGSAFRLRVADKSIQYSLHKASKELLYIPTSREVKYKAKAVIDMFAYRCSAVLSTLMIIPIVKWVGGEALDLLTIFCCAVLVWLAIYLARTYTNLASLAPSDRLP